MNWRKTASILQVLLVGVVWIWLGTQYSKGTITGTYFTLYFMLGLAVFVHGVVTALVDFGKNSSNTSRTPIGRALFWFETSPLRPLSYGVVPLFVFLLLSVVVLIIVGGAGTSFFNPVNPYQSSTGLSVDSLSQHGWGQNIIYGAVIPGIFEEGITFFGVICTIALIQFGLAALFRTAKILESGAVYWFSALISLSIWSFLFAVAHARYGGNQDALIFAFGFEFLMQLFNLLTGSFLSWIPHILHNTLVITTLQFSTGILSAIIAPTANAVALPAQLLWRKVRHE